MILLYASAALAGLSTDDVPNPTTTDLPDSSCPVSVGDCVGDVYAQEAACDALAAAETTATGQTCQAVYLHVLCWTFPNGCSQLEHVKCVIDCKEDLNFPFDNWTDIKEWYATWSNS